MSDTSNDKKNESVTEQQLIDALRTVYDPEIPVSIYELGLIYDLAIDQAGVVQVRMTLTSPACPVAGILPGQVETALKAIEGVSDAKVELVWEPPWTPDRMSEAAKLTLNMDIPPPQPAGPSSSIGLKQAP